MTVIDKVQMIKQVLEVALKIVNVLVSIVNTVLEKLGE